MVKGIIFAFILCCFGTIMSAQEFLQLEVINSMKTIKYAPGDKLVYQTLDFPDEWQKRRIQSFHHEEGIVIFEHGMEYITNISKVREFKGLPFALAKALYAFSARALVFGVIDLAYRNRKPDLVDVSFVVLPTVLAYFLDRVVSYKSYKMNKNARLRLLDLRL